MAVRPSEDSEDPNDDDDNNDDDDADSEDIHSSTSPSNHSKCTFLTIEEKTKIYGPGESSAQPQGFYKTFVIFNHSFVSFFFYLIISLFFLRNAFFYYNFGGCA